MSQAAYVPRSGEQVYPPPYSAAGVQLYGFAVRADHATLQERICNRYLNEPMGVRDRFVPAAEHVMFVFNTIDQLRSMTPPFDQRGWFPEQEAAVWIAVADRERERLFWYHPYMLVDNGYAMAMGREIYGFPKELGWFDIPRGVDAPERLSVDTLAVRSFGPEAAGERLPLFTVKRGATGGDHTLFGELKELAEAVTGVLGLERGFLAELGLAGHMFDDLLNTRLPMAFLKQFRDGSAPLTACYQAVQEVDSRLVKLHGAKLFGDRYEVEIEDLDSHPLRADFGLPAGPLDVEAAFWLNFDFEIGNCTEVWRGGEGVAPVPPGGIGPAPVPPAAPPTWAPSPGGTGSPAPGVPPKKKRIAILGGGTAAMATAWRLTSEPDWQQRYEITIHQMGWRLGGKGASGRRPPHGRIEEHGLHIWLGFYHNAFRALQDAHRELNPGVDESVGAGHHPPRILGGVFARCEDAFQPHSYVGVDMTVGGEWDPWMMRTPVSDDKPWERDAMPSVFEYLQYLGEFLSGQAFAADNRPLYEREREEQQALPHGLMAWVAAQAKQLLMTVEEAVWSAGFGIASALGAQVKDLHEGGDATMLDSLVQRLQGWVAEVFERQTANDPAARRHLFMLDMGATILRGLVAERAFERERFNALDDEFRGWLRRHGAMPVTTSLVTNPLLRGLYDFVFAFDGGDTRDLDRTANFATAPALRTIMRMCFTYDGSIFWKMRAGMGDTIFTPFYKALAQRGVKFEFFHRVQALRLDASGTAVQRVEIARQVTPKNGNYHPLVNWEGLDCWPSEADYTQLEEGDALREAVQAQGVDLESMWFKWPDAGQLTLERGRDFDEVVFAIALGSVPFVAADLLAANQRWREMVEHVKTVRTMGLQLWMAPDLRGLGWLGDSPVIDAYMEPFDTWADMSHLLPREDWKGAAAVPRNVAYFCGAMTGSALDPNDAGLPAAARAEVHRFAEQRVMPWLGNLWPGAVPAGIDPKRHPAIDPKLVLDRYERANIDPTELYVMSAAGSSRYRIKANQTGFSNLFIAGDWIDNGFNAGCVEAAMMSGLQAANAVIGKADINDGVMGRELN